MRVCREGRGGKREGGGRRRRREEGTEVKSNFTQPPETRTPVRLCPPTGYGTLVLGSGPPSQMLRVCVCVRWEGGGREEEGEEGRKDGGRRGRLRKANKLPYGTKCVTHCFQWWGRRSPQTGSPQTGLPEKTSLQELNIAHEI